MKKTYTLIALSFFYTLHLSAQETDKLTKGMQNIRQEMTSWDATRGEWLASSMEAMMNKKPTPDRTFPEEYTPAEMFRAMPTETQDKIRGQLNRMKQDADSASTAKMNRLNAFTSRGSNCNRVMGRTYGDPHLKSFDGASYSFQTVGEFTLVKSGSGHMNIQVRQRPQSDNFSLNTAVAMNVDGDRIGFYANEKPDGNTSTPLRIEGEPIYIENQNYYLEHGGTITKMGNDYLVTWPTGERAKLSPSSSGGMRFYNVAVEIYPCNDTYDGLLGNANGRSSDDFESRNGGSLSTARWNMGVFGSTNRTDQVLEKEYLAYLAKDFARDHRITQSTSLFDYGFNQSTLAFTDESFPRVHYTIGDLASDDYRRAERECARRGFTGTELSACIYDNGFLRIEPTPKPNIPDRTTGRTFEPVRTPITNRNPGQKPYTERYPIKPISTPEPTRNHGNLQVDSKLIEPEMIPSPSGAVESTPTRVNSGVSQPVRNTGVSTESTNTVKSPDLNTEPIRNTSHGATTTTKQPSTAPVILSEPIRNTSSGSVSTPVKQPEIVRPTNTVKTPTRIEPKIQTSPTPSTTISTPPKISTPSSTPIRTSTPSPRGGR